MNVWGSQLVINSWLNYAISSDISFVLKKSLIMQLQQYELSWRKAIYPSLNINDIHLFSNCTSFLGFTSYPHIPVALFFSSLLILSFPKCYSSQPGASGIHMTWLCFDVLVKLTSALRLKTHNIHFQDHPPRRKRDGGGRESAHLSCCQPSFYTCSCIYTYIKGCILTFFFSFLYQQ